jgi:hypothetical protein
MARREEEFYCNVGGGGCGKYFKTWLRSNMWGNYTIECPACGHHHFRVIKDGLITDERHDKRMGNATVIQCLKSTISDTPWHNDPTFRRSQIKAYSGGTA